MSEYWKSTPKYWCKFCKTYVRDTALEKKQHDATPKHQNNIQRSLRDLHKGHERDERDKQRANDEVARLNGIVAGKSAPAGTSTSHAPVKPSTFAPRQSVQASEEQRKRQVEQLASLGVAVPQEYRKDLSIAGEWSTVSETPIYHQKVKDEVKDEDDEDKPTISSFGVRKRKLDDEEDSAEAVQRSNWGSTMKAYPGAKKEEVDFDALLDTSLTSKNSVKSEQADATATDLLKKEESQGEPPSLSTIPDVRETGLPDPSEDTSAPPVVFKKRKGIKR